MTEPQHPLLADTPPDNPFNAEVRVVVAGHATHPANVLLDDDGHPVLVDGEPVFTDGAQ